MSKLAERMERMLESYPRNENRQLHKVTREAIAILLRESNQPTAGDRIVAHLNEYGPQQYGQIKDALNIPQATLTTALQTYTKLGKIATVRSKGKDGNVCRTLTYSTPAWDAAHSTMRADFASSWMRNPTLTMETEDVQD